MADEINPNTSPTTRKQLQDQQRKAAMEQARKEHERTKKAINAVASTNDGIEFLSWFFEITGLQKPTYIQDIVLSNVGVDQYLAGYAEGRRSLGALIDLSLTPENKVKLMKKLEVAKND